MFHVGVRRILFDHRTSESLERKGLHSYQSELFFRNNNPCAILLSSFVACFACSENQTEECKPSVSFRGYQQCSYIVNIYVLLAGGK